MQRQPHASIFHRHTHDIVMLIPIIMTMHDDLDDDDDLDDLDVHYHDVEQVW